LSANIDGISLVLIVVSGTNNHSYNLSLAIEQKTLYMIINFLTYKI